MFPLVFVCLSKKEIQDPIKKLSKALCGWYDDDPGSYHLHIQYGYGVSDWHVVDSSTGGKTWAIKATPPIAKMFPQSSAGSVQLFTELLGSICWIRTTP